MGLDQNPWEYNSGAGYYHYIQIIKNITATLIKLAKKFCMIQCTVWLESHNFGEKKLSNIFYNLVIMTEIPRRNENMFALEFG